VDDVEIFCLP